MDFPSSTSFLPIIHPLFLHSSNDNAVQTAATIVLNRGAMRPQKQQWHTLVGSRRQQKKEKKKGGERGRIENLLLRAVGGNTWHLVCRQWLTQTQTSHTHTHTHWGLCYLVQPVTSWLQLWDPCREQNSPFGWRHRAASYLVWGGSDNAFTLWACVSECEWDIFLCLIMNQRKQEKKRDKTRQS